jgi:hypothetical protein
LAHAAHEGRHQHLHLHDHNTLMHADFTHIGILLCFLDATLSMNEVSVFINVVAFSQARWCAHEGPADGLLRTNSTICGENTHLIFFTGWRAVMKITGVPGGWVCLSFLVCVAVAYSMVTVPFSKIDASQWSHVCGWWIWLIWCLHNDGLEWKPFFLFGMLVSAFVLVIRRLHHSNHERRLSECCISMDTTCENCATRAILFCVSLKWTLAIILKS